MYTLMVVILPCAVLHRFLKGRSLGPKGLSSVLFWAISSTLCWSCSGTFSHHKQICPDPVHSGYSGSSAASGTDNIYGSGYLEPVWIHLVRFLKRENSFRFTLRIFFRWAGRNLKKGMKAFFLAARRNLFEFVLFVGCSSFILYFFSLPTTLAPRASILSYICIGLMKWITAIYSAMVSIHLVCMRFSIICMRYLIYIDGEACIAVCSGTDLLRFYNAVGFSQGDLQISVHTLSDIYCFCCGKLSA